AMIRRVVRLLAAGRVAQMVRQLPPERPLDNRLLKLADRSVKLLGRDRPLANKVIQDLVWHRRQRRIRCEILPSAAHSVSSCYAPHTKFRIPSRSKTSTRATAAVSALGAV